MQLIHNYSLRDKNTFGIETSAKYFGTFSNTDELEELLKKIGKEKMMVLGGGSNILFTGNFDGYILKNEIKGIDIIREDEHHVYIKAGAGENWHQFVNFCLSHDLAGIENLSLIPGNVGASPMQNIGAYGVEIKDVFHQMEAYHLKDKKIVTFTTNDCAFGYRDSVFKNKFKHQFVILDVTFRLNKIPILHTSYGAIEQELEVMKEVPSIHSIAKAVVRIRSSKLPDPREIGNAGSFFKNPSVPAPVYEQMKNKFPDMPGYPQYNGTVKLAAGWLIEQCGWKGYRKGDAGCHARQALVLVNYGNASGKDIYSLSEEIRKSVRQKFSVDLEREVNIV